MFGSSQMYLICLRFLHFGRNDFWLVEMTYQNVTLSVVERSIDTSSLFTITYYFE